ncbi:MAG: hypothetical protein LUE26_03915 [Alistipes sp.]|nr:hypothetical protein [Alistipes sp.]
MRIGEKSKIVLSTLGWCALAGYLVFAVRMCRGEEKGTVLTSTRISITDRDEIPIVDEEEVRLWLRQYEGLKDSTLLSATNTAELREYIESKPFVKRARVYTDLEGRLTVEITQRQPVARFSLRSGHDFYVSDDMRILPVTLGGAVPVPLVTGNFPLPFDKGFTGKIEPGTEENGNFHRQNYLYFSKLINFVRLIGSSAFWDAQIVQVNVEGDNAATASGRWKEPQIELIPRVGRHIIIFGELEDVQEKLDKLMLFYTKVLDYEGWETYRTINLRFKDQVVCTRR